MAQGPGLRRIPFALLEEEHLHVRPGVPYVLGSEVSRPNQVPHGFVHRIRHPDECQLAGPAETRQLLRVPNIVLDPFARSLRRPESSASGSVPQCGRCSRDRSTVGKGHSRRDRPRRQTRVADGASPASSPACRWQSDHCRSRRSDEPPRRARHPPTLPRSSACAHRAPHRRPDRPSSVLQLVVPISPT